MRMGRAGLGGRASAMIWRAVSLPPAVISVMLAIEVPTLLGILAAMALPLWA